MPKPKTDKPPKKPPARKKPAAKPKPHPVKALPLDSIRVDGGTQARVSLPEHRVEEYAEALADGVELPPAVVFFDGSDHWLADGFTRYRAHEKAGKKKMPCEVRPGTKDDALRFACGANATHGEARTNADKRNALRIYLSHPEWCVNEKGEPKTDGDIARAVGVSRTFVLKVKSEAGASCHNDKMPTTRTVTRNGQTYTQDTANIGKGKKQAEEQQPEQTRPQTDEEQRQADAFEDHNNADSDEPATGEVADATGDVAAEEQHPCAACGVAFSEPVWHCPHCQSHSRADEPECHTCLAERPADDLEALRQTMGDLSAGDLDAVCAPIVAEAEAATCTDDDQKDEPEAEADDPAAPEADAPSGRVYDAIGIEITDPAMREVFQAREHAIAAIKKLQEAQRLVTKYCDHRTAAAHAIGKRKFSVGTKGTEPTYRSKEIDDLISLLNLSAPHVCVCYACHYRHPGRLNPKCPACLGHGFTTKLGWGDGRDGMPPEEREAVLKLVARPTRDHHEEDV